MKKSLIKIICTLVVLAALVIPTSASLQTKNQLLIRPMPLFSDFDPLVDNITVTVTIQEIRALDTIDVLSEPDFYVIVTINGEEFVSDIWENALYVTEPNWAASAEVPKEEEFVDITIALWDKGTVADRLCDLSTEYGNNTQSRTVELRYSIAAGCWWGDDSLGDSSGYGRLNGCDDNSIYQQDRDCELIFDISQNDYDGDGFPYWLETEVYNTSPLIDNRGEDEDQDGIPIEWEHHFGLTYFQWGHDEGYYKVFDPFVWEDHTTFDDDKDGLTNKEEYLTWQWGSDPFRQDIFVEIDQMEKGPNGQGSVAPLGAYDLLRDSHAKHNIFWHVDYGQLGGGEFIPFKETLGDNDLTSWYWNYFMHQDVNNWRRGVFHWGIIGYNSSWANGFTFSSKIGNKHAVDCFYISSAYLEKLPKRVPLVDSIVRGTFNREKQRELVYAGAIMHETGHSLNIRAPGVDVQDGKWPWEINYWRYGPYKSVMNYRYIYSGLVDYSDGSHGKNDYDDWADIDLTYFNPRTHW